MVIQTWLTISRGCFVSKYTPDQLQTMAVIILEEEEQGSQRPLYFYITVGRLAGIPPLEVREITVMLAGETDVQA